MKMKKNLFMIAAVALAAVACNKEVAQEQLPAGEVVTFEASTDGADTKVVLDGKVSKWENGDKITIHNGTKGYEFSTTDEGAKAEFTYTGDDFSGEKFIAVYPAGTYTADVEAKTVTAVIPDVQPSRDNSFSVGAVPSVAYSETQSLMFRNAAALLKFTVKGTNVKGFFFSGNNNEVVAGNALVTLNEDNTVKTVVGQDATKKQIELWANTEDYYFNEETAYYVAVIPQNFSKGFSIKLKINDNVVDFKTLETAYELKPNTILNLGELEYVSPGVGSSGWSLPGSYNNWNTEHTFLFEEGDFFVAKNVSGIWMEGCRLYCSCSFRTMA